MGIFLEVFWLIFGDLPLKTPGKEGQDSVIVLDNALSKSSVVGVNM